MKLKKDDFVEIEFTGKVKGGEIFDSNTKDFSEEKKSRPFVYSLGNGMFLNRKLWFLFPLVFHQQKGGQ